jgi:hypothetical protein
MSVKTKKSTTTCLVPLFPQLTVKYLNHSLVPRLSFRRPIYRVIDSADVPTAHKAGCHISSKSVETKYSGGQNTAVLSYHLWNTRRLDIGPIYTGCPETHDDFISARFIQDAQKHMTTLYRPTLYRVSRNTRQLYIGPLYTGCPETPDDSISDHFIQGVQKHTTT